MSFDGWLDARDGESLAREWATLDHKQHRDAYGPTPYWSITTHGIVQFAASFLSWPVERLAWLASTKHQEIALEEDYQDAAAEETEDDKELRWPEPSFRVWRPVTRSFFEHWIDFHHPGNEAWQIREVLEGSRGIQHHHIAFNWTSDPPGSGGSRSATALRVFDRETGRAASLMMHIDELWTIGDVDLTALDLYGYRARVRLPTTFDLDAVRGLIAQITADLDAHFDTSVTWDGMVLEDRVIATPRVRKRISRFAAGAYAVEVEEFLDPDGKGETGGWSIAKAHGLPWGWEVSALINGEDSWIDLQLPFAMGESSLARLAAIPGIEVKR